MVSRSGIAPGNFWPRHDKRQLSPRRSRLLRRPECAARTTVIASSRRRTSGPAALWLERRVKRHPIHWHGSCLPFPGSAPQRRLAFSCGGLISDPLGVKAPFPRSYQAPQIPSDLPGQRPQPAAASGSCRCAHRHFPLRRRERNRLLVGRPMALEVIEEGGPVKLEAMHLEIGGKEDEMISVQREVRQKRGSW
jgi:hypothetical protein